MSIVTIRFAVASTIIAIAMVLGVGCGTSSKQAASGGVGKQTVAATSPGNNLPTSAHPADAMTHGGFIAAGDAICAHLSATLDTKQLKSAQEVIRAIPVAAMATEKEYHELRGLAAPPAMVSRWKRFLTYTHEKAEKLNELAREIETKDESATVTTNHEAQVGMERAADVARHLGFKQCGIR